MGDVGLHRIAGRIGDGHAQQPRPDQLLGAAWRDRDQVIDRVNAFGSGHSSGANFAFADGSVCFMSDKIDLGVFQSLSTRAGGEVVERF